MSYDDTSRQQDANGHNREIGFIDFAPTSHEVTDERRAAIMQQLEENARHYNAYARSFFKAVDEFQGTKASEEAAKKVAA